MPEIASFGQWIKQRRVALDLTQDMLAERVACSTQMVRKMESGERRPSHTIALRLAQALDVPPADQPAFLHAAQRGTAPIPQTVATTHAPHETHGPTRLPTFPTRFVGREQERTKIVQLLADPTCHLLTLVGPGGVGKTRLAVEVACACNNFVQGVVFVPLAPVSKAELLVAAIADALGFTFYGSEPPPVQLVNHLRDQELLLVLDNMEHLLDGSELLATLIEQAPRVTLLVTSRERLNLRGEWVIDVAGLPTWHADANDDRGEADAVILFAERARQIRYDFCLTSENRHAVRWICRLVGGMPLGIELAASWVRILSCAAIAAELEHSLDFLQVSSRNVPERHRSLRAVFDHSWQLLDAAEQRVLRRLNVFRGGFDRTAAVQIADATLPMLSALVDKSLVRCSGSDRYDLHEVVRQYAGTYVKADSQEHMTIQDRHCAYFAAFLAAREQRLKSGQQRAALTELLSDIDNIRAAWRWAAEHRRLADMRAAIPALFVFYEFRGAFEEAAGMFGQAVDALKAALETTHGLEAPCAADERLLLGEVFANQAWFAFRYGQFKQASDLLQRSLSLLGQHSQAAALSTALPYLWMLRPGSGDYAEAQQLLCQRLDLLRARGDQWGVGGTLFQLSVLAQFRDEHQEAYRLIQEALLFVRTCGDPIGTIRLLGFASGTAYTIGAHAEAQHLAEECITMNRETGDRFAMGLALNTLGLVALAGRDYQTARVRLEESLAIYKALGDHWSMALTLHNLGYTLHALGARTDAYQTFLQALQMAVAAKMLPQVIDAIIELATLLRDLGQTERALELCLHVLQQPGSAQQKERGERLREQLERLLPPQRVTAIVQRVEGTSFADVITTLGTTG